ncbi:hypothetical protein BX589_10161 [Paraburkholderia fungorum]|uniref:hypothetical protein n=1 Tax=Paraburkholderia fungorum TaxID=134537 RepID=UPI000D48582A|nr:hypothetical protein [Paraburkholderia fungorum]PRZ56411.1 hypothetical protein BX589_10161 [Paraburkholderia fungorum]
MTNPKSKAAILMLAAPANPLLLPAPAAEQVEAKALLARIAGWRAAYAESRKADAESRKFRFLMEEARIDIFIELAAAFTGQERAACEAERIAAMIKESAPATPAPSRGPRRV